MYIYDVSVSLALLVDVRDMKQFFRMQRWKISDFTIRKKLRHGRVSEIFLAAHNRTGMEVVLKKCRIDDEFERVQLQKEVTIHSAIEHPRVISFYGYFYDKEVVEGSEYSAEDPPVIGTSGTCKFGFTDTNKINLISMRFDIFTLMAQIEKHVKEFAARRKKGTSYSI